MSEFNIEVQGGSSVRLPTAGKYCDRDIIVTASGGGTEEIEQIIDESGVLDSTDGTVEEKVEQLIDKAKDEILWYEYSSNKAILNFSGLPMEEIPKINYQPITSMSYFFNGMSNLKRIDHYINSENCTNFNESFSDCSSLTYVKGVDMSAATRGNRTFTGCNALVTIEEPLNIPLLTNWSGLWEKVGSLVNVRFVSECIKGDIYIGSPVLSAESIQSIVDGLAYVDTTQNLTLSNKIVLTDNQKQVINAKGWTLIQ